MTGKPKSKKTVIFIDMVSATGAKKFVSGDQAYLAGILYPRLSYVQEVHPQFAGREIKATAEGTVMIFDDIESAVSFSICLQDFFLSDAFISHLSAAVRVGIAYGDAEEFWDDEWIDVTGAAVVCASRICAVANAGQILVSQDIANSIDPHRYRLAEWPGYILKGIDGIHSLFQVLWGDREPSRPEGSTNRLCQRLQPYVRPLAWRNDADFPDPFTRIRLISTRTKKSWEYDVSSNVACFTLAEALAVQHFSPFPATSKWFLYDEEGNDLPSELSLGQSEMKQEAIVGLRLTFEAPPLDPSIPGEQTPLQRANYELKCTANFSRAIATMEGIVRSDPHNVNALNNLASAYLEADTDVSRAAELLRECLRVDPSLENDVYVQDTLGWLAYRQGEYRKAEGLLFKSLEAFPREEDRDGYKVVLYHHYFALRRQSVYQVTNLAREELMSWISEYGQMMLYAKRVRINDDSCRFPDDDYFSPQWLRVLGVTQIRGFEISMYL